MKIAITGPEGSGKTTLAKKIVEKFPNLVLIPELVEETLRAEGLWLGNMIESLRALRNRPEESLNFQAWLSIAKAHAESDVQNRVSDRTQMDNLAYTLFYSYTFLQDDEIANSLIARAVSRFHQSQYDYVFYLPISGFAEGEERREVGIARITALDGLLRGLYQANRVPLFELTESTIEGRLQAISEIIDR